LLRRRRGGDGEEENDGDAAAALPHAVAPMEAPSVYSRGGAEERMKCDGNSRLAAEQGSQMAWSVTTDVVSQKELRSKHRHWQQLG
jgi:hypothetical protein